MLNINKIFHYAVSRSTSTVIVVESVEIKKTTGDDLIYSAIRLKQNKSEVYVEDKITWGEIDQLNIWINAQPDKQCPILLIINSNKIIHKVVPNESNDLKKNIGEHFTSVVTSDFYGQLYTLTDNSKNALSVTRKSHVDSILGQLSFIKDRIIYCHVGPFYVTRFYDTLFIPNNENFYNIHILNYTFNLSDKEFIGFNIEPYVKDNFVNQEVQTDKNNNIPASLLIAYSYGIDFLLNPESLPAIDADEIYKQRINFFFRKKSRMAMAGFGCLIFLLLLISSTAFTVYHQKYSTLLLQQEQYKRNADEIDQQNTEYQKRNKLLAQHGFSQAHKVTFITDNITNTIPDYIFLRKLIVYPENKKNSGKGILFNDTNILISGNCYSIDELEAWLDILKQYSWIKGISINDFRKIDNTDLYEFSLDINKLPL